MKSKPNLTEMVFKYRHKAYGAYELRANYSKALITGLLISIGLVILFSIPFLLKALNQSKNNIQDEKAIVIDLKNLEQIQETSLPPGPLPPAPTPEAKTSESDPEQLKISDTTSAPKDTLTQQEAKKEPPNTTDSLAGSNSSTQDSLAKAGSIGSMDAFKLYIKKNLNYPTQGIQERKECIVHIVAYVNEDGSMSVINLRGCEGYFDEEAKRLVTNAPRWIPFKDEEGKPKRQRVVFEVPFQMLQ